VTVQFTTTAARKLLISIENKLFVRKSSTYFQLTLISCAYRDVIW